MARSSPRPTKSFARLLLVISALATLLVGAVLEMSGWGLLSGSEVVFPNTSLSKLVGGALMVVGLGALAWSIFGRGQSKASFTLQERIAVFLADWNARDDELSARHRAINLFLISFLGLFFELALIRWLGTEIKVFAYLKNVVLIAAFLGLGLGYFISRRPSNTFPLFLPLATALVGSVAIGVTFGLWTKIIIPDSEQLVLLGQSYRVMQAAPLLLRVISWIPFYAVTLLYFSLIAVVFIPVGQYTGKCMRYFAPIPGYSLNVAGSLAGTLMFTILSFAWLPPAVWFALAAIIALVPLQDSEPVLRRANWGLGLCFVLVFVAIPNQPGILTWSPYNQIVVSPLTFTDNNGQKSPWGYQLSVGEYYYYQDLVDLSTKFFQQHPNSPKALQDSEYEVPYQFIRPKSVLVLGAGGGNDVAAALRNGAQSVDAVEIDPAILQAGQEFHPEHPYDSTRVHLFADDARSYIKNSARHYDLVLFGLLDSYQVISAFGAVRLDNFVYTIEGMKDAYALVEPDGILAVTFEIYEPWMGQRINGILEAATGQKPLVIDAHHGTVFLIRRGRPITTAERDAAIEHLDYQGTPLTLDTGTTPLTVDDWPFLYMRDREIPLAYLTMLPILGLAATWMVRRVGASALRMQWHFFFLGAGFLLMEVRVIGQIALLFGSTWVVNVVAIASILLMALLANALVAVTKFRDVRPWGILLLIALVVSSIVPSSVFLSLGQGIGGTLAALLLALPVFFSSIVFSTSFRQTSQVDVALASNLVGSILGGFVEYLSLLWGIGSLAWIAALLYAVALVTARQDR